MQGRDHPSPYLYAKTTCRDAVTNPERIPRRFLPMSGNLKIGGGDQLEGNAGGTTVAFYTTIPEAAPET